MPRETPDEEARLVARLVQREEAAWEELLRRYGGMMEAACRRVLRQAGRDDAETAADALGEVFRALLEGDCRLLRRFRPGASLGAYLHVLARHRAVALLRREDPRGLPWMSLEDPSGDPAALAEAAEREERLAGALASLPAQEAGLLALFHLEGLSYREIAGRTGLGEAHVGVLLSRAREALRERLGKEFGEFP